MPYIEINKIQSKEIFPGMHFQLLHTDKMTFSFLKIENGAVLPEHSHPHEQVTIMQKGKLELVLDGEKHLLEAGSALVIPSNAVHSATALTEVEVLDVFCPVREDYK